ncbi:MAG TPA: DUF6789 family protein [Candidatus Binatia bacterium]
MNLPRIRNSIIAGLCGTAVHSLLLLLHSKTGPLPEFQPNADIQRSLGEHLRAEIPPSIAWLLLFVNFAVIWSFVFGQTYRVLPGKGPLQKGIFFGVCAWAVMGFVFFPLVNRGIFAVELGLGIGPAALMLVSLLAYSVTMSFVYHFLDRISA